MTGTHLSHPIYIWTKQMNRTLIAIILTSMAATAYAEDAPKENRGYTKIRLYGSITGETCTISGARFDGNTEFGFPLPTVSANALTAAGSTAGENSTTFYMSGCPAGTVVRWEKHGSAVDSATGALINDVTDGSNVQVQVLDSQGSPINLNSDAGQTLTGGPDSENLYYSFRYLAKTVPVTGGAVDVTAAITVSY